MLCKTQLSNNMQAPWCISVLQLLTQLVLEGEKSGGEAWGVGWAELSALENLYSVFVLMYVLVQFWG